MFKVGLCKNEDPHFGRQNMAENIDFWWVGLPKMSSAFDICTLKRAEEAEAEATETEVSECKFHPNKQHLCRFRAWGLVAPLQ